MKNGCFSRGCFWSWLQGRWVSHCFPCELFKNPHKFSQRRGSLAFSLCSWGSWGKKPGVLEFTGSQSQTQLVTEQCRLSRAWAQLASSPGVCRLLSQTLSWKRRSLNGRTLLLGEAFPGEFPAGWELLCLGWGLWPECLSLAASVWFPSSPDEGVFHPVDFVHMKLFHIL